MTSEALSFNTCSLCATTWKTQELFLNDVAVEICGYQANPQHWESGFFLFQHHAAECGNTMSVSVMEFTNLKAGVPYPENRFGTPQCGGHCLDMHDMLMCDSDCRNAWIRDILASILKKHWEAQSHANNRLNMP